MVVAAIDSKACSVLMLVAKNICDSVIGTPLNIQGKTKDDLNTCQDLAEMDIRSQLHLRSDGKKYTCLQLVILCPERKRSVFVSVCAGSKSHKDTLQILRVLCS